MTDFLTIKGGDSMQKIIKATELIPGMQIARCVVDSNGKVILSEGVIVTDKIINRLGTWDIRAVCIHCSDSEQ
jgi:hypothetical protein